MSDTFLFDLQKPRLRKIETDPVQQGAFLPPLHQGHQGVLQWQAPMLTVDTRFY